MEGAESTMADDVPVNGDAPGDEQPVAAPAPNKTTIMDCADELLEKIFIFCNVAADAGALAATCRRMMQVATGTKLRANWLVARYGRQLAFHKGLLKHRRLMAGVPGGWDNPEEAGNREQGPSSSVPHALANLGIAPSRHVVQQFYAWFSRPRRLRTRHETVNEDGEPVADGGAAGDDQPVEVNDNASIGSWESVTDDGVILDDTSETAKDDDESDGAESEDDDDDDDSIEELLFGLQGTEWDIRWRELVSTAKRLRISKSAARSHPIPPTLAYLGNDPKKVPETRPRRTPPPKPHDQILLLHLLSVASKEYGARRLALNSDDSRVLRRLVGFDDMFLAEDFFEGIQAEENNPMAHQWLQLQRKGFEKVKDSVTKLVDQFGYSPLPPIFPDEDDGIRRPMDAYEWEREKRSPIWVDIIPTLMALAVKSPELLQRLLIRASIPTSVAGPVLLSFLLTSPAPISAVRDLFSDPILRDCGIIKLDRATIHSIWDSTDFLPDGLAAGRTGPRLAQLVRGVLLSGEDGIELPGPQAIQIWAKEKAKTMWTELLPPILSSAPETRKRLMAAITSNPGLPVLIGRNFKKASHAERDQLHSKEGLLAGIIGGQFDLIDRPGVICEVFCTGWPEARDPDPISGKPVYLAIEVPALRDPSLPRVAALMDSVFLCTVNGRDTQEPPPEDDLARVTRQLRLLADAAFSWLLTATDHGLATATEVREQMSNIDLLRPGPGTVCDLVRRAADTLMPIAEAMGDDVNEEKWSQELMNLGIRLELCVELGTMDGVDDTPHQELFENRQDFGVLFAHEAQLAKPGSSAQIRLTEILNTMLLASTRHMTRPVGRTEQDQLVEQALSDIHSLFEPAEDSNGTSNEPAETLWVRSARSATDVFGDQLGAECITYNTNREVKWGDDVELRRICWFLNENGILLGLGFLLSDYRYQSIGAAGLCSPPQGSFLLEPGEQLVRVTGLCRRIPELTRFESAVCIVRIQFHTDRGRVSEAFGPASEGDLLKKFTLEPLRGHKPRSLSRNGRSSDTLAEAETRARSRSPQSSEPSSPASPLLLVPGDRSGRQNSRSQSRSRARTILGFSSSTHRDQALTDLRALWKYDPLLDKDPATQKLRERRRTGAFYY